MTSDPDDTSEALVTLAPHRRAWQPVLSIAMSLGSLAGLHLWQRANIDITGDRSCPPDVTYAGIVEWLPCTLSVLPALAMLLALAPRRTRSGTAAAGIAAVAALLTGLFWWQLLPLLECAK